MTSSQDMIRGRSNVVTLTNNSGGALVAGDVCVQDTSADENATTTTSAASVLKVFIAAESIAAGATGKFYESGYCPLVNVNASVTRGRFLFTHTVAKQAAENATYGAGAFGKILKSGTTPSALIYSATAQIGASSGAALKRVWSPDAPPASPTAQDDEFNNGSLDVKWTEFDPNNVLTVSESSTYNGLLFTQATRAGINATGIYQTIPAGDFTIWTKVSVLAARINYGLAGLCMWENPSDTAKSLTTIDLNFNATNTIVEIVRWTNHNTFSASPLSLTDNYTSHVYLRLRRNGTNYYGGLSTDGISWYEYTTNIAPLATPTKFGVYMDNQNTGISISALFHFFRYVASDVGVTGILSGRLIDLGTF